MSMSTFSTLFAAGLQYTRAYRDHAPFLTSPPSSPTLPASISSNSPTASTPPVSPTPGRRRRSSSSASASSRLKPASPRRTPRMLMSTSGRGRSVSLSLGPRPRESTEVATDGNSLVGRMHVRAGPNRVRPRRMLRFGTPALPPPTVPLPAIPSAQDAPRLPPPTVPLPAIPSTHDAPRLPPSRWVSREDNARRRMAVTPPPTPLSHAHPPHRVSVDAQNDLLASPVGTAALVEEEDAEFLGEGFTARLLRALAASFDQVVE